MNTCNRIVIASVLVVTMALTVTANAQDPATPPLKLRVFPIFPPSGYGRILGFDVRVYNTGESDIPVRLGTILGNGESYLEAVVLILTDASGSSSELVQFRPEGVGGQMFDWTLPLSPKVTNSFTMALNRCWIPATKQPPPLILSSGTYRVRAEFRGRGAIYGPRPDGRNFSNLWLGTVRSEEVEFTIK